LFIILLIPIGNPHHKQDDQVLRQDTASAKQQGLTYETTRVDLLEVNEGEIVKLDKLEVEAIERLQRYLLGDLGPRSKSRVSFGHG